MEIKNRLKSLFIISSIGAFITYILFALIAKEIVAFLIAPFIVLGGFLITGIVAFLELRHP